GGIVGGSQHTSRWPVAVAFDGLKIVDDFALVPDVIASGDDVNVQLEQFFGEGRCDAESGGRILAVGHDQVDFAFSYDSRQEVFDDRSSRPSEDVADEENSHENKGSISMVPRVEKLAFTRQCCSYLHRKCCLARKFGKIDPRQHRAPGVE